jgi:Mg/Co/Ni transporter MgtE
MKLVKHIELEVSKKAVLVGLAVGCIMAVTLFKTLPKR